MDEQREWLKKRRKRRLRFLAALLCFAVIAAGFPGIWDTLSAYAALPDEGWNQAALPGIAQAGLALPDAVEEALAENDGESSENTIAGEQVTGNPVPEGAGEEKAPENSAPKEPVTETPAPKEPIPGESVPENPASKEPVPETPAPENPTPEAPAPEDAAPENPAPETPVPDKPATDEPVPEEPSTEKPKPEEPSFDNPVQEESGTGEQAPEGMPGEEPVSEAPVPEETKPEESPVTEKPARVTSDEKNAAPAADTTQKFTVTFYDDDGTVLTGPIEVTSGEKVPAMPADPTKTGYKFNGWVTKNGDPFTNKAITENTSVYASWTAKTFTVTFKSDGQTIGTMTVAYGERYDSQKSLPANPSKEGHLFNGWNTKPDGTGEWISAGTIVKTEGNHEIYACWASDTTDAVFRITYDLAGGVFPKGVKPQETYKRTTADFNLKTPQKVGYKFIGWSGPDLPGVNKLVTVKKGSSGGRFYTANWEAATYSVTFHYNGATGGHSAGKKEVTYDATYGDLPEPTKKGEYSFMGWYIDPELKGGFVDASTVVSIAKNHGLYARWKNPNGTCTVTLKSDKGYKLKPKSGSVNPVKEGGSYTFVFDLKDGYRKKDDFAVLVNGRRVKLSSKDEYTIEYIYEDKVVTVEGVEKKTSGEETPEAPAENQSGDGESSYFAVTPAAPAPKKPATVSPAQNPPAPAVSPESPAVPETAKSGAKSSSKGKTTAKSSGTWKKKTPEDAESKNDMEEPSNDPQPETEEKADIVEEPEPDSQAQESAVESYSGGEVIQSLPAAVEEGRIVVSGEPVSAGNVSGMLGSVAGVKGAGTSLTLGSGSVTVKVVCEAAGCKAGVTDAVSVANAVLTADQIKQANAGENTEIRIDVKDISETVTQQDRNVIADCIEDFGEELPGLTVGMYADISVYTRSGGGEWNAVTDTDDAIGMVIGIPENLPRDDVEYYMIRAHDGGYSLLKDRDEASDTITVNTDRFSSYAIVYREPGVSAAAGSRACSLCHICPTFFGSCCFLWLALATAIFCVIGLLLALLLSGKGERGRHKTANVGTEGKNMCRMYK